MRAVSCLPKAGVLNRYLTYIAALAVVAPTTVFAVPMLDQEFDPATKNVSVAIGTVGGNPAQNLDAGQTFTVGITGILTSVELLVGRDSGSTTESLLFDIRTTTAGVPAGPNGGPEILDSFSIPALTFPIGSFPGTFTSVDLTGIGINVVAGDVLAIVVRSLGDNPAYLWTGSSTNSYASGSAYRRVFSTVWEVPTFANDWAFRTFVDPATAAVPEPATVLLMGLGLAGLGFARRRRVLG